MTLEAKHGSLLWNAADPATTTYRVDLGWQPKVVFLWWSGYASLTDGATRLHARAGFGIAISTTTRYCAGVRINDSVGNAQTNTLARNDAVAAISATNETVDALLDISAWDSTGFTLIVDDAPGNDTALMYLALGGDTIEEVYLGDDPIPGSTGAQDLSFLGWQPDFAMYLHPANGLTAMNTCAVDAGLSIGAASGPSNQFVVAQGSNDAPTTMQSLGYTYGSQVIAQYNDAITALEARGEFVGFDSDGWDMTWPAVASGRFIFLALKTGGHISVRKATAAADGDPFSLTTGWPVKAMLAFSGNGGTYQADDTPIDSWRMGMGGGTGPSERGTMGVYDRDAQGTSSVNLGLQGDALLMYPEVAGFDYDSLFDIVSMDSDGITLQQISAGLSAREFPVILFGEAVDSTEPPRALHQYRLRR